MTFQELTLKQFVDQTASDAPVPGGGSVSALCSAIASGLAQMVAGLTAGKKGYEAVSEQMSKIAEEMPALQKEFLIGIDTDSQAFDMVMAAFKLPKSNDEEKAIRRQQIREATKYAAEIPMKLARNTVKMLPICRFVAQNGNKNALSDIAVSTMLVRTATMGALYNVKINLASLPEDEYRTTMAQEVAQLEEQVLREEKEILATIVL